MPRTKIICTIGPSSQTEDVLRALIRAGMSVARINFSHGDHAEHARDIAHIRAIANDERRVVAILADLQGPKFRIGEVPGEGLLLKPGERLVLTSRDVPTQTQLVMLPHPELIGAMRPGNHLLIDDGLIELVVERVERTEAITQVLVGGTLKSHKGISLVGGQMSLPAVTSKDRADLDFAIAQGVDYIAQSFVRTPDDVLQLRALVRAHNVDVPIIAKIEKAEALQNFEAILRVSDGIMVARGDLGVETSLAEVPVHQKRIIHACNLAAKPVITATQMLESMTWNPRPTRAEASDVANAVLDGTDAVMLSNETATGLYPVITVETMIRIITAAETVFPYDRWLESEGGPVTESISAAACEIAHDLNAAAILSPTMSGYTARAVAHHRPRTRILAMTPKAETCRQLALVWGVEPYLIEEYQDTDEMIARTIQKACTEGLLSDGTTVVITAGVPVGDTSKTNMIQVRIARNSTACTLPN